MEDLKHIMRENYLTYASYVILERAIPNVVDGLKPVQRRILYVLKKIHDGKLHKVANVAGQTMAFHPHGDAAITEALVNMAIKNYLLDMQGNFGNLYTGDPAAAPRYIETRLSQLATETLFNPDLTETIPSYDGRNSEPVTLPAKIPVLLMQGAEGIAVGMSTRILPHNFVELLEAQIAHLEGRSYTLFPDFPTGGTMDVSEYDKGNGKVKLRATLDLTDGKTIVIREICYGTTTESLIRSVDEAAKKGNIKIDSIHDYTSEKVEIEIKLPRGHYAEDLVKALYAHTECEVTLNSMPLVIKDNLPWQADVHQMLEYHVALLQGYLKKELEIERTTLLEKIFNKTLERIFIENKLYHQLEKVKVYEKLHSTVEKSLVPYHDQLIRIPTPDDIEKLLNIPIRRITQFDLDKNLEEIAATEKAMKGVERQLKNVKKYTIDYIQKLIDKYGALFPRKTKMKQIEELDKRAILSKKVVIGYDSETGFIGTKVSSACSFECTNFDKILLMFEDGMYKVINIPEKLYVHHEGRKLIYVGVADKSTVINVVYKEKKTGLCYAKRFVVSKFILEKEYQFLEEGTSLEFFSTAIDPVVELLFTPKAHQKISGTKFQFGQAQVKGVTAKGVRIANREIKKVIGDASKS